MIKKGDRVRFLNDTGGGVVTDTSNPKMAMVLIDDGFEVPVPVSELIPVSGQQHYQGGEDRQEVTGPDLTGDSGREEVPLAEAAPGENEPGEPAETPSERNILGGLVEKAATGDLEFWLINDSGFSVFYSLLKKDDLLWLNIKTGHIDPDTKIRICSFSREELNSFITLKLQALFYMKGIYEPVSPSQCETELDPADIYSRGSFAVNDFFDDDARIIPLISDPHEREVRKMKEQEVSRLASGRKEGPAEDRGPAKKRQPTADPLIEEVDLHIENLVDDPATLSGREALDIQMARFTTVLEGALRGRTKRVVFIHGIGQGKLKFEIRKALDRKYPRLRYQDASFREYGYGATMVIIRK